MFLSRGIRNKCLVCSLQTSNKIMDSFDSTDKVNKTTVHSVTLSIYYTKLAQLQNFKPHGAPQTPQTWSFKPFSFKVIKHLHFLPLLLFVTAQNIPIPYWKTAASCWGCTLVTKSTYSEYPHYFFQDNSSIKTGFILCLSTSIMICTEYSEVNLTGAHCPSKHYIFNWVAKQLEWSIYWFKK